MMKTFPCHTGMNSSSVIRCPGQYCGRTVESNGTFSSCGACPRGFRPDVNSICQPCQGSPTFYDWLYLGFMALLSLNLHWFFIDFTNKRKDVKLLVLHISALIESALAAVVTIYIVEPFGELHVRSCPVYSLADWYTMLYNPSPDYVHTIHCTQEVVYPLYTIVMIYYAACLVFMMLLRPIMSSQVTSGKGAKSIYAALYFFPILTVVQAIFGGLLYYAFPYMTVVVSVTTVAIHFALFENQEAKYLIMKNCREPRNILILFGHWILHAYGIVAVTQLKDPVLNAALVALVPFPTLFYIITVKYTHPSHLEHI